MNNDTGTFRGLLVGLGTTMLLVLLLQCPIISLAQLDESTVPSTTAESILQKTMQHEIKTIMVEGTVNTTARQNINNTLEYIFIYTFKSALNESMRFFGDGEIPVSTS
jgi:hypothetical protein